MRQYVLEPKRTKLIEARLEGDEIVVNVPENDDELAKLAGRNEDGSPKLTLHGLAQAFIAQRIQAAISKFLTEGAETEKNEKGEVVGFIQKYATEAELADIVAKAEPEAYRLLVGERAAGGGRKSAKAQVEEALAAKHAEEVAKWSKLIAEAPNAEQRSVFVTMAKALGYGEAVTD